ncbi:unnamed protein product [Trichogramma brassicae]|uniref:Uncharacterized protein n=1 Tax=Trichogramma brassicae TaxID=86971 RepID=A0A6H5I244_9HYME|nr:unnamed protein product [Trichogramma brassicae]
MTLKKVSSIEEKRRRVPKGAWQLDRQKKPSFRIERRSGIFQLEREMASFCPERDMASFCSALRSGIFQHCHIDFSSHATHK